RDNFPHHHLQMGGLDCVSATVVNPVIQVGLGHELVDFLDDVLDIDITVPVVCRKRKCDGLSQSWKRGEVTGPCSGATFAPCSVNNSYSQRDDFSPKTGFVLLSQMLIEQLSKGIVQNMIFGGTEIFLCDRLVTID